jgi:integrase
MIFSGWNRISEVTDLDIDDLEFQMVPNMVKNKSGEWVEGTGMIEALIVHIGKSKTDQEGKGETVVLPEWPDEPALCPVRAARAWLDALWKSDTVRGNANTDTTRLFRRINQYGQISTFGITTVAMQDNIARLVKASGIEKIKGHSFRLSGVTAFRRSGGDDSDGMAQSRHKSRQTFEGYDSERRSDERKVRAVLTQREGVQNT